MSDEYAILAGFGLVGVAVALGIVGALTNGFVSIGFCALSGFCAMSTVIWLVRRGGRR